MNAQRRYAHNFTDSLNSFHQTISEEANKTLLSEAFLEDTLKNESVVSDETLYLSSFKPDLNKCINLFHNEYLNKECDSPKEQLSITLSDTTISENIIFHHLNKNKSMGHNLNRLRSISTDSLKDACLLPEFKRSKSHTMFDETSKKDTNYNIKGVSFPVKTKTSEKVDTIIPSFEALSLSNPALNRKDDFRREDQHDSINSEISSKDELNPSELKTLLCSLTDQKPLKETAVQQHLLRRLSMNYHDSPKVFTEGLLTIIEESVINNDSTILPQRPEISLFRFNEELQKMCKFLEDETTPEWPKSPNMSTSICAKRKSEESNNLAKSQDAFALSLDKEKYATPVSSRHNIKSPKRLYRHIPKNTSYIVKNLHDSTNTFESLEAMCKQLSPDDSCITSAKEKNMSQFYSQNMTNILDICERQMASLEDSPNIHEQIKKAGMCTPDSAYQHNKPSEARNLQYKLLSNERYDRTDLKRISDTLKQIEHDKHQEMELNDYFESTLMYEIAKKRQRCLDTAKIMMEIDGNFESAQKICPNIVISESSPTEVDDKFMKTLLSVKTYQDDLEKYKPFLSLLHRTKLNSTSRDRKYIQTKETSNENFNTCTPTHNNNSKLVLQTPKLSPRRKNISPSSTNFTNETIISKPPLFVTPGKTCINKSCKPKRTYFPNLLPETSSQERATNTSPQEIKFDFFRQNGNYSHVISPVKMYIKGEQSHLIKNLWPKTLIPKEQRITQLSSSKIQLSPKQRKEIKEAENKKVENH